MKDDRTLLLHINDAIARVESYTSAGRSEFMNNTMVQDAVVRNLAIIGEAVKSLSQPLKDQATEVPWKLIAGMRDVLIHAYFSVSLETVWEVVEQHLQPLQNTVDHFLTTMPPRD